MKIYFNIILSLYFFVIPVLSTAQQNTNASPLIPQSASIAGTFLTGPINGFVQIPDGGRIGTSSPRRPTFSELGIHHSNNYDFEAGINWDNISLYGGYQYIRPHGSATLDETVITHGKTIQAGSNVSANLKFDWYRLGSKYNFYLLQNKLILAPLAEADVLNFGYNIPDFIEPRKFNSVAVRIGLYGAYYFKSQFFVDAKIASSIPILNLNIVTAEAKLNYTFFNKTHVAPSIFIGFEFNYLNFEDQQTFPNHIQFNQPMILAGLSIKLGDKLGEKL